MFVQMVNIHLPTVTSQGNAITSISTSAFKGSPLTTTQLRAGL